MIGFLTGKIIDIEGNKLTVSVGGVGYEIAVSESILRSAILEDEVNLFVVTEVREDSFDLFGFLNKDEKSFYKKLRSINGVGPRTAINILSMPVDDLKTAIEKEDIKKLTTINGLGKKTAERMILELKGKLPDSLNDDRQHSSINDVAVNALKNLGYKNSEINPVLSSIPSDLSDPQEIVKFFLKHI